MTRASLQEGTNAEEQLVRNHALCETDKIGMRTIGAAGCAERCHTVMTLCVKGWSFERIAHHTALSLTGVFNMCKRVEAQKNTGVEDSPGDIRWGCTASSRCSKRCRFKSASWIFGIEAS